MTQIHERVITAVVIAQWYTDRGAHDYSEAIAPLSALWITDKEQAFDRSGELLVDIKERHGLSSAAIKEQFALTAPEKSVVFLGISGDSNTTKATWYPYFSAACDQLQITDPNVRQSVVFSGIGIRELMLCVVAYVRDQRRSFISHELLHITKPGLHNTFFDEMMTESLAYADSHIADLTTFSLLPKHELPADTNTDYYDWLVYFFTLCRQHDNLFGLLLQLYDTGDDAGLDKLETILGTELYHTLRQTAPDSECPWLPLSTTSTRVLE